MSRPNPRDPVKGEELDATLPMTPAESGIGAADVAPENEEPRFFDSPKRIVQTIVIAIVLVVAIYLILPQIVDAEDGIEKLGEGDPVWIAVAVTCAFAMFFSYMALFRGVVGTAVRLRWHESYQITMAGLAATRLFSAGGAGGIALTYWALRKAGMTPKDTAARMVAFNVLLYAVYMLTLVINGILMSAGVFEVPAPPGLTIVPAAIAGGVIVLFLLFTFVPGDLERRFSEASQEHFWGRTMRRVATVPSTLAVGMREAFRFVREPERGAMAIVGAIGFWAAQIAILWASFKAFGADVPIAVVVQGFFVGMLANLIPLPGGVGGVDAGMIGAFELFDVPHVGFSTIVAAVLAYRLIAFWLPMPPGVVAFIQLRRTVAGWEKRTGPPVGNDVAESLPGSNTS